MRFLSGYMSTTLNNEDFALTPYIFIVSSNYKAKIRGFGICWGYAAVYIGLGVNIPKAYPTFLNWNKIIKNK